MTDRAAMRGDHRRIRNYGVLVPRRGEDTAATNAKVEAAVTKVKRLSVARGKLEGAWTIISQGRIGQSLHEERAGNGAYLAAEKTTEAGKSQERKGEKS